ncbi:MAG: signal recognition particle-docking protein FtsY [Gammaproteobacteria bacterium]|nr:signal recognition particle-docking protein FtsY [Gammaproteobacteria bacterium]
MLERLKQGINRSRRGFAERIRGLLGGGSAVDAATLDSIEEILLTADVGVEATDRIITELKRNRDGGEHAMRALRDHMVAILEPVARPLEIVRRHDRPYVILMVGVNGVGKTTTIAKLAKQFKEHGHRVLLAAGDTFRAAAVEQLTIWGERHGVPVVSQKHGADPASVLFDAVTAARARRLDVVIADTAGRLHTQSNLMDELRKVKRVIAKIDPDAPDEVLLVIDATTGQNALAQTREFHEAIGVTGIALTKLDGSAKGGIVLALAERFGIPIRYVGVGEGASDLMRFDAAEYVDALLATDP